MTQYRDCDGDVWEEGADGALRIVESSDSINIGLIAHSLARLRFEYGPLTDVTAPDLDPERLEKTLRAYVSELDYDIHKGIESGEQDGLDHYPEEVAFFLRCWDDAGS